MYVLAIAQQKLVRKLVFQRGKSNKNISKEKRKNRAEDVTYYRMPPTAVPSRISKLFGRVCIEDPAFHASTYKHYIKYPVVTYQRKKNGKKEKEIL